ncbi:MAG: leucine-rich repeat domain-containing protein, partial [Candidatus Woesearchaeota archaeon]
SGSQTPSAPLVTHEHTVLNFANGTQTNISVTGELSFSDIPPGNIDSVIIGTDVTSIGNSEFQFSGGVFQNRELKNVIFPSSVTKIGSFAFANNDLTNIVIPNSVEIINNNAFSSNNITSLTIPHSVTEIWPGVFNGNFYLSELYMKTPPNIFTWVSNFNGINLTYVYLAPYVLSDWLNNYGETEFPFIIEYWENSINNVTFANWTSYPNPMS